MLFMNQITYNEIINPIFIKKKKKFILLKLLRA